MDSSVVLSLQKQAVCVRIGFMRTKRPQGIVRRLPEDNTTGVGRYAEHSGL